MITKRLLGLAALVSGIFALGGLVAYDVLRHHPIGQRLQLVALALAIIAILVGISLIPLGNRPV